MTGMTAQEYGKNNIDEAYRLLFRGLIIAFIGALLLILFQNQLLEFSLFLIDTNAQVNQQVSDYFKIRIYAAPATIGLYAFIGWFLGKQNATLTMVITVLVNLLNAGISYYLVTKLNMQTKGVALGTVIAQYIGFIVAVLLFAIYYAKQLTSNSFKKVLELSAIKKFVLVNTDILIRTLCLIFALSFFKVMSAKQGEIIGAANILLLEFITIATYGIDGFAFAAEAISGKYYGAKNKQKFNKAVRYCFYWGFGFGAIYGLVYWIFGYDILNMLTNHQEIIHHAMRYLVWLIIFPILSVIPFVWDGIYIGLTSSKAMRNTMLLSTVTFVGSYYLLQNIWGNHGVWLAMIIFVLARGISQTLLAKKVVYAKLSS